MNVVIRLGDLQRMPEELGKDLSATGCKLRIWIYEIINSDEALGRLLGRLQKNQVMQNMQENRTGACQIKTKLFLLRYTTRGPYFLIKQLWRSF